ncbi:MAG: D-aminoacyl-tRNA deacylase [Pseudohongiellaceae bacterium]|nr:D-aminoacyl-tRNA deacylase [Pseudohongiellaceae bacterium]
MIALLQRVNWAQLRINGEIYSEIAKGLVVFVGIEKADGQAQADKLLTKISQYRVFADEEGRMNKSLLDIDAQILLVSQFTLAASTDKGLRPSFSSAMPPPEAEELYDYMVAKAKAMSLPVATGCFGADMKVALENDGPVTFTLRS